jgi:hypothetical protein
MMLFLNRHERSDVESACWLVRHVKKEKEQLHRSYTRYDYVLKGVH